MHRLENLLELVGKNTLITGASGAIGAAVCSAYSSYGQNVTALGRSQDKVDALNLNGYESFAIDLTNETEIKLFAKSCKTFDNVILCHGREGARPMRMINHDFTLEVLKVNLISTLDLLSNLIRAKKINSPGRIIFISSVAAHIGSYMTIPYSASKAGAESAMQGLASDLLRKDITVNSVAPAAIESPIWKTSSALLNEERYPLGRGLPEDVANTCLFLSTYGAKYITGETIILDGGTQWLL